jgi:hypothetical protein
MWPFYLNLRGQSSMEYKREIERKFVVDIDYNAANILLGNVFSNGRWVIEAVSFDLYWKAPNVDFIRLRDNSNELTVKVTDKGTVTDRIEENVVVERDSMATTERLLNLLYGKPGLTLFKKFSVMSLKTDNTEAVICLYEVYNDPKARVFLEVESDSIEIVNSVVECVETYFVMYPETRSLFQIFIEEGMFNEA